MDRFATLRRRPLVEMLETRDTPAAGVSIAPLFGTTSELGVSVSVAVKLTSQPAAPVTINLRTDNFAEGRVSRSALIFTPTNWNITQQFLVVGQNDRVPDGNKTYHIVTSITTIDAAYRLINPRDLTLINIGNGPVAGVGASPSANLLTTEAGGKATTSVKLTARPTANVTVAISSTDTTEGVVAPTSIVFTPFNWAVARTITVTGKDDTLLDGDINYKVRLKLASTDTLYNGRVFDITAKNRDNETRDGLYRGRYIGTISAPIVGNRAVSGDIEFRIRGNTVTLLKPGPGTGTMTTTGAFTTTIVPSAATIAALNLPSGVTVSNVLLRLVGTRFGAGTWTLTGKVSIPLLGTRDFSGSGSWSASRISS